MALPSNIARTLGAKYGRRLVGDYDPNDPLGDAPAAPQYDVAVGPISINSRTPADGGGDELAAPEEMRPPLPPVPGGFKVSDGPDAEPDADADDSAHMAMLATASRPPVRTAPVPDESWGAYGDAKGLSQARASDRESMLAEMFQRAGRQMISGLTRTPEAATVAGPADAEKRFLSAQAMRREAALKALKDAREGRVADADVELKLAEADKARRLPVAPVAKPDHFAEEEANKDRRQKEALAAAETRARIAAAAGLKRADAAGEGQKMTAGQVDDLTALDLADEAINNLEKAYNEKASGLGSSVASFIPGTEANTYGADLQAGAKTIGKGIEGARMTDADMATYMKMVPTPSDSNAKAAEKIATLRGLAKAKRIATERSLKAAGFKTPESVGQTKTDVTTQRPGGTVSVVRASDGATIQVPAERAEGMRKKGLIK